MIDIAENLKVVLERIELAAKKSGRKSGEVKLIAVGKTQPVEYIEAAYNAGQRAFGENYAQELEAKAAKLPRDIEWHFIGALQTNKVKKILPAASVIHSLDRENLAIEINKRAEKKIRALVEINVSAEESKSGIDADNASFLVEKIAKMEKIDLCGLMTMPPFFDDPESPRPYFAKLRALRDAIRNKTGIALPELSMGMTGDFETAIEEGATMVRIGTAVFGQRNYDK